MGYYTYCGSNHIGTNPTLGNSLFFRSSIRTDYVLTGTFVVHVYTWQWSRSPQILISTRGLCPIIPIFLIRVVVLDKRWTPNSFLPATNQNANDNTCSGRLPHFFWVFPVVGLAVGDAQNWYPVLLMWVTSLFWPILILWSNFLELRTSLPYGLQA